jgi:hypothetical protein
MDTPLQHPIAIGIEHPYQPNKSTTGIQFVSNYKTFNIATIAMMVTVRCFIVVIGIGIYL